MAACTLRLLLSVVVATFLVTAWLPSTSNALYFYLEGSEQKCFIEELPKDTMVISVYKAEEWSDLQNQWIENPTTGIRITIDELPQGHRLSNQMGASSGRFTFTSTESGDHAICLSSNNSAWFSSARTRLHLDMDIGDPTDATQDHKEALGDLAQRVRDLNTRVHEIRREQAYQREREAEFRDQSESTNSRVVWWTIAQIVVLGVTCLWQMRHLKGFFEAKKLV
ncbi:emp24/gp25L/p24 family/GOLD-domain-containing protein [Endogone sp. FLAS-F59071]|nr:emp24/gp25L/p24 family/GOLD-domain-containing protein [Endogone sp. FLAS-F59071]|eukprot:RUS22497.1 emp24/gp25L/p24 family/GOLD-domain-containing protein [Endogone sp. FLAS-F59071]